MNDVHHDPLMPQATRAMTPDGTTLAFREIAGDDRLVVYLHGFTSDSRSMMPLAHKVHGAHASLLVDVVGHGQSDSPEHPEPYTITSVVDQILSLIGPRDPGTVHLVGYSMGARIAVSIAARAPWYFGSLTMISGTAGISVPAAREARQRRDQDLATHIEAVGVNAFAREWLDLDLFAPLRQSLNVVAFERLLEERGQNSVVGLANSLRGTGTGSMPPVWQNLGDLRAPLLALAGSLDHNYLEIGKQLAETAYDGTFALIQGRGHSLCLEAPDQVAKHIGDVLARVSQMSDDGHRNDEN